MTLAESRFTCDHYCCGTVCVRIRFFVVRSLDAFVGMPE